MEPSKRKEIQAKAGEFKKEREKEHKIGSKVATGGSSSRSSQLVPDLEKKENKLEDSSKISPISQTNSLLGDLSFTFKIEFGEEDINIF